MSNIYEPIIEHYKQCFTKHGDNHLGADWPNSSDANTRYQVMLDFIKQCQAQSVMDFGCGSARWLDYLNQQNISIDNYYGVDLCTDAISCAQEKYPQHQFLQHDLHQKPLNLTVDCVIANGVFTEKCSLSQTQMWEYLTHCLEKLFHCCRKGLAFNVMSTQVDYERDDLFHLSMETLETFIYQNISKHYQFRHDYGLYEYTCYVFCKPNLSTHDATD